MAAASDRDDEPKSFDRGQAAEKRFGCGCVLALWRLQIVEHRDRRLSFAGGGDFGFDLGRRARSGKAEIGCQPAQDAFRVWRGFKIDEEPSVPAEALDDARIVSRCERERRLAHAERARHDNRTVPFEDRLDELVEPILAADHFWVGCQRRGRDGGLGRLRWNGGERWDSLFGRRRRRLGWGRFAGRDLACDPYDLIDSVRHVLLAVVQRIAREGFLVARTKVLVRNKLVL